MIDRLNEIAAHLCRGDYRVTDVEWLMEEVDRLRALVARLRAGRDVDRLGYGTVGITVDGHPFELLPDIHADQQVAEAYANDATEPDGARYGVVELLVPEER